ncbi:HAMP domain-containing sensor histidine kinase [Yoonia sp. BS5-3]|uniref:histidine kinase n=1 Tax=Yoonia phaeophyticola TaxID=3137369 RepID=A0ABZ2V558_9RHOB
MKSLRARAVVGGILSAIVIIALGITGLASLGLRQTEQSFDAMLERRHEVVIAVVETYRTTPDMLARRITDPDFQRPFSGEYWQIQAPDGSVLASPSLQDMRLPVIAQPDDAQENRSLRMPDGQTVRNIGRLLQFDDGQSWYVQVASSLQRLQDNQTLFRRNLLVTFGVVAAVGVFGALLQVTLVLRPLNALRRDVARRWQGEDGLDIAEYPTEVVPLVNDINSLLERNREISHRSRRQAADLAHAIKTPSAILRNALEELRQDGHDMQISLDALDRLDAQLNRSFARMRADGKAEMPVILDVSAALDRMVRAFDALARNAECSLIAEIAPDMHTRIEPSDFDEIIGNLLDNAVKWSKTQVRVNAFEQDGLLTIVVADDGSGIAEADMAFVTQSGQRLDTAQPGTGLGLAIVKDLTHAYDGALGLERADTLGGLAATVTLKAAIPPQS